MKSSNEIKRIIDIFEKEDDFLLTAHLDPDGDSIGSLLGLAEFLENLGKRVVVYNEGRLPNKYKFLDPNQKIRFEAETIEFEPRVVVVLECPEYERIGFVKKLVSDKMKLINIDHHPKNTLYGDINYIDDSSCAVAEILYEIIRAGGKEITPHIAEAFYAAIASDTGRFKFANTTSKCFKIVSELARAGANPKEIADKIFSSFSGCAMKLLGHLLQTLELHADGKICVLKLRLADLKEYGVQVEDTEGIIDYSLLIEGVKVGMLFKERNENLVKIGLRSQDEINIGKYAISKGGGGHVNAAGFSIEKAFDEAVEQTIAEVTEFLHG